MKQRAHLDTPKHNRAWQYSPRITEIALQRHDVVMLLFAFSCLKI